MNSCRAIGLATFLFLTAPIQAVAADQPAVANFPPAPSEDYYHLCTESDLVNHVWKLQILLEVPKRKEATEFRSAPNQYIEFLPQGNYLQLLSATPIADLQRLQRFMQATQTGPHAQKYTIDKDGILNLFIDKSSLYSFRCLAVDKRRDEYLPNDLILRGYTRNSRTALYELYRRLF